MGAFLSRARRKRAQRSANRAGSSRKLSFSSRQASRLDCDPSNPTPSFACPDRSLERPRLPLRRSSELAAASDTETRPSNTLPSAPYGVDPADRGTRPTSTQQSPDLRLGPAAQFTSEKARQKATDDICSRLHDSQHLDAITELAATLFRCPASTVTTFGRAGGNLRSSYGVRQESVSAATSLGQLDLRQGLGCCNWVLGQVHRRTLVIEDCTADIRVRAQGFAHEGQDIRFYAGAPLVSSDGHIIGVLCVYDTRVRKVGLSMFMLLGLLAEYAVLELEGDKLLAGAQPVSMRLNAGGQPALQPVAKSSRQAALAQPPACAPDKHLWHLMPAQPQLEEWLARAAGAESPFAPCCDPAAPQRHDSAFEPGLCEAPAGSGKLLGSLQRRSTGASSGRQSASDLPAATRMAGAPVSEQAPCSRGADQRLPSNSMSIDTGAGSLGSDTTVSQLSRAELGPSASETETGMLHELPASSQAGNAAACTSSGCAAERYTSPAVLDQRVSPEETLALSADGVPLLRTPDILGCAFMLCNAKGSGWPVRYVSRTFLGLTGIPAGQAMSQAFWALFCIAGKSIEDTEEHAASKALPGSTKFSIMATLQSGPYAGRLFDASFQCLDGSSQHSRLCTAATPALVSQGPAEEDLLGDNALLFAVTLRVGKRESLELEPRTASQSLSSMPRSRSLSQDAPGKPKFPTCHPEVFEHVTLGPLLGKGGNGRVYLGTWESKQVAIKVLDTVAPMKSAAALVHAPPAEVRLVLQASHPNLVPTFQHAARVLSGFSTAQDDAQAHCSDLLWGAQGDSVIVERWLLLEYCTEGCLQDAVERGWFHPKPARAGSPPDMQRVLRIALDIASGMDHMHQRNYIHGDLAPGNVLLAAAPDRPDKVIAKVSDFGLSRALEAMSSVDTKTFGTVTHMPPELLMEGKLTKAADVFAFGVLLWSMYTAWRPWQGLSRTQVMIKVTVQSQQLQLPGTAPQDFQDLVNACLERKYKERPTFKVVLDMLSGMLSHKEGSDATHPAAGNVKLTQFCTV